MPVKLTKEQTQGLDLLIAAKQMNPTFVNWVDIVQVTVQVAVTLIGAAASRIDPLTIKAALGDFEKLPIEKLIDLRNSESH